jgi:hypothetical protein
MSWKLNSLSWKLVSPSPMLQWILKHRVSKRTVPWMSRVLRTVWMVMVPSFCYCLQLALVSVDTLFDTLWSLSCYERMGQYVLLSMYWWMAQATFLDGSVTIEHARNYGHTHLFEVLILWWLILGLFLSSDHLVGTYHVLLSSQRALFFTCKGELCDIDYRVQAKLFGSVCASHLWLHELMQPDVGFPGFSTCRPI